MSRNIMTKPLVLFEGTRFRVEQVLQTLPDGRQHEDRSCGIRGR